MELVHQQEQYFQGALPTPPEQQLHPSVQAPVPPGHLARNQLLVDSGKMQPKPGAWAQTPDPAGGLIILHLPLYESGSSGQQGSAKSRSGHPLDDPVSSDVTQKSACSPGKLPSPSSKGNECLRTRVGCDFVERPGSEGVEVTPAWETGVSRREASAAPNLESVRHIGESASVSAPSFSLQPLP